MLIGKRRPTSFFFQQHTHIHHKPRYSICYVIHIGGFPSVRFWLCGVIEFSRYIGTWNTWYKVKISLRFASLAINPRRANLRAPNSAHNMICPIVCGGGGVWVWGVNECVSTLMFDRVLLPGGGPLECQGGYQARPKIHVIRGVFQDQVLYARTSFIGAKTCKIGKKGVFWVIQTNFGKNMTGKLRKMHAKTRI